MFWKTLPQEEVARLRRRYDELGSLQALADEENMHTGKLGRVLTLYDRRVAGSDANYDGPERRHRQI